MAFDVMITKRAELTLTAEMEYVYAEFGERAARKAYSLIMEKIDTISSFPKIGVICDDMAVQGEEVRILHGRKLSIIYSVAEDVVWIHKFWNNRQDLSRLSR